MAGREDLRLVFLFYACRDCRELAFSRELDGLTHEMNLKLIDVLEHPPAAWGTGFVDALLLRRFLPKQYRRFQYFVCGPPPMMDALEATLPALSIPPENIHTERFDMI